MRCILILSLFFKSSTKVFDLYRREGCTAFAASMSAWGGHFDTLSARSVICDVHAAAGN